MEYLPTHLHANQYRHTKGCIGDQLHLLIGDQELAWDKTSSLWSQVRRAGSCSCCSLLPPSFLLLGLLVLSHCSKAKAAFPDNLAKCCRKLAVAKLKPDTHQCKVIEL